MVGAADLNDGVGLITRCQTLCWPIDRNVLLSVDQVGAHHREVHQVERGGVLEELGKVEDQTMTSGSET